MRQLIFYTVLSILLGVAVGYFLSTYVVVALTMLVAWLTYTEIKPAPRGTGADGGSIGGHLIVSALFICFLLCMWITWIITPGSTVSGFDMRPVLDFLRHYILK